MNVIGIIAEYNPFHNGHKYQIDLIKRMYKDSIIVVCLSGSFTQRGDISILNKFDKTRIALELGVNLVVELPFVFSTSSADTFGKYGVRLLSALGVNLLCLGSETNDINVLKKVANVQINNEEFEALVSSYYDNGINYPTAVNKAVKDLTGYEVKSPNDLLAVSYIKEILRCNYNIECLNIKRTNDFHDLESNEKIVSASNIRNKLCNGENIKKYVPDIVYDYLKDFKYSNKLFELLKYKIISEDDLSKYLDVDEGIERRIKKVIMNAKDMNDLILKIKSKRYTYNKINRMLCHILCSFMKSENDKISDIEYIRVLGFDEAGQKYLSSIKSNIKYPILNSADTDSKIFDIEKRVSFIYSLIYDYDINFDKSLKPIIKTEN